MLPPLNSSSGPEEIIQPGQENYERYTEEREDSYRIRQPLNDALQVNRIQEWWAQQRPTPERVNRILEVAREHLNRWYVETGIIDSVA